MASCHQKRVINCALNRFNFEKKTSGSDKNQIQMPKKREQPDKQKERKKRNTADASNLSLNQNQSRPVSRRWMDKQRRSAKSSRTGGKLQESE